VPSAIGAYPTSIPRCLAYRTAPTVPQIAIPQRIHGRQGYHGAILLCTPGGALVRMVALILKHLFCTGTVRYATDSTGVALCL